MKKCLIIVLILALGLVTAGCGKSEGRWVLIDSEFHEEEWYAGLARYNQITVSEYPNEAQVSEGSFTWIDIYNGPDYSDKIYYAFPGNSFTTQGSWTKPPETINGPGYVVSMDLKIEAVDWHPEYPVASTGYIHAHMFMPREDREDISMQISDDYSKNYFDISSENDYASNGATISGGMGEGKIAGERRIIQVWVGIATQPLMSYIYEWQE